MIAIIEGIGSNINSMIFSLKRIQPNIDLQLTKDPAVIAKASHVILPGVGHAQQAMQQLQDDKLIATIQQLKQPVLGICLGMQILCEHLAEGNIRGLGIIPGAIDPLLAQPKITIPHMGWNQLQWQQKKNLIKNEIDETAHVYFVHSYAAIRIKSDYVIAYSKHGQSFAAIINHNNFYGMQFHPERSGPIGEQLLLNFLTL